MRRKRASVHTRWRARARLLGLGQGLIAAGLANRPVLAAVPVGEPNRRPPVTWVASLATRQVQLGSLLPRLHPAVAVGAEYPTLQHGDFRFFPLWRLGLEHHQNLQDRAYLGVTPSVRWQALKALGLQIGLGLSGLLTRSSWRSFHFESESGRWTPGSELHRSWLVEAEVTAWLRVQQQLDVGLSYGFGAAVPFSPANDLPALPLTRLGLCARWSPG